MISNKILTIVGLSILLSVAPAFARNHALLVGVGEYPFHEGIDLEGPPNDVRMMSHVLQDRGFAASEINILTDGMSDEALPTRKAILNALVSLSEQVSKGDFVYLQFGGHGARQPQPEDAKDIEADGLDEIFLPRDIGQWKESIQTVENAITDNEFDQYISAIRAKGAFVWAVFDTCHSGTMVRGAPMTNTRFRKVDESRLGIPEADMQDARAMASRGVGQADMASAKQSHGELGGYVAFYGAQSDEPAPEMMLPARSRNKAWHGMLTYTLAQILSRPQVISYRQAMQRILQQYAAYNLRTPTPLFEGSVTDARIFGQERMERVVQWPLSVKTANITIPAGSLAQVDPGSVFAIMAEPQMKSDEALGYLEVASGNEFKSTLLPVAYKRKGAIDVSKIPKHAWGRLIHQEVGFQVAIALPDPMQGLTANEKKALSVVRGLASEVQGRGIRFQWVKAGDAADLRLGFSPRGDSECSPDRLWLMSADGELRCNGSTKNIDIVLDKDKKILRQVLMDSLQRMAKVLNLQRIAANLSLSGGMSALDIRFEVIPVNGKKRYLLQKDQLAMLTSGDKVSAYTINSSKSPYDLSVLFVDGRYGITPVFPSDGQLGRIEAGGKVKLFDGTFNEDTLGMEYLLVIGVEAEPGKQIANFSYLSQLSLPAQRSVERKGEDIQALFKAAGFGLNNTRGVFGNFGRHAGVSVYRWTVSNSTALK